MSVKFNNLEKMTLGLGIVTGALILNTFVLGAILKKTDYASKSSYAAVCTSLACAGSYLLNLRHKR